MKRLTAAALLVLITTPSLASALAGDKAAYAGGTIARFNVPGKRIEGRVEIGPRQIVFVPDLSLHSGAEPLLIDYESIHHLEFGQKASRRMALVAGATVVLGPLGLMSLPARSRVHYLTLTYAGEHGGTEVVVIELGKHVVRSTLAVVEARSGVPIENQDEEARKWRR
jgi:hypothetical protein